MFAAGGKKDRLVTQPQDAQGDDRRHYQHRVDQADVAGGGDRRSPGPGEPGDNSAHTPPINTMAYKATSTTVRVSPWVNGTLSGQAGSRIVLGRNQ